MRVPMAKRAVVCVFNIIFPPVAVGLLTGFGSPDTFLNCILFLLAIIPSHIHGFYISLVYFHRKGKIRKGEYPGGDMTFVHSEKVVTGGAGYKEARRLKRERNGKIYKEDDYSDISRRSSRRSSRSSRRPQSMNQIRTSRPGSIYDRNRLSQSGYSPVSPIPISPVSSRRMH